MRPSSSATLAATLWTNNPLFDEEADNAVFALFWTASKKAEAAAGGEGTPGTFICRSPVPHKPEDKDDDPDPDSKPEKGQGRKKGQQSTAPAAKTSTSAKPGKGPPKTTKTADVKEWPWNEFYLAQFELQATRLALLLR